MLLSRFFRHTDSSEVAVVCNFRIWESMLGLTYDLEVRWGGGIVHHGLSGAGVAALVPHLDVHDLQIAAVLLALTNRKGEREGGA